MDDFRLSHYRPIAVGKPTAPPSQHIAKQEKTSKETPSFQEVLQKNLNEKSNVGFSKHAVKRAIHHQIDLSEKNLVRLNEAVRRAGQKHLEDTLILMDDSAFVVNVKNNTVITAMHKNEIKGNVFTNIHGAVII